MALRRLSVLAIWASMAACTAGPGAQPEAATPAGSTVPAPGATVTREVPAAIGDVRLSFAPIVRQVAPAVVSITSRRDAVARNPFADDPFFRFFFRDLPEFNQPRRQVETSLGSGVILREEGVIVTNHHVVDQADEVAVILQDKRSFPAKLLSSDAGTDLAFLKIDTRGERLPALALGNSDAIEVGDIVLAVGNPFGIGQTVTSGIVSAKERTAPSLENGVSFIQTDAAINPGNSGGALVTLDARLIGINTAIFTRSGGSIGIGFAIPSNLVRARMATLSAGDARIRQAFLGAQLTSVGPELAQTVGLDRPRGVAVTQIYPGSAADRAGMALGDIILAIDGTAVDDPSGIAYRLALKALGERAELEVLRRGDTRRMTLPVEAARRVPAPDLRQLAGSQPLAGAAVANMSPGYNEELGLDPFERGVVVVEVARGSPASQLRLRRGDVILTVNGTKIEDAAALEELLKRRTEGWQIGLRRDGQATLLTVRS